VTSLRSVDDAFLTVADIAGLLKLNQQTVRNWIERGELPAYHLGRRIGVSRRDFEAFVEAGQRRVSPRTASGSAPSIWDGDLD
jgi:excisionase family DNA binding protein